MLYIDNETDWQDLALRDAFSQNYQFGISGGKNATKYYISANYSDTEGIMNFSEYRKMGFRAKIDTKLNERVSVGININPSYSKRERPSVNFTDYVKCYSFLPYRHTEATAALTGQEVGSYAHPYHFNTTYTRPDGTTFTTNPWTSKNNNPLSTAERYRRYQSDYRLQSSAYIDIKIFDGLTFRSSNGVYFAYNQKDEYMEFDAKEPEKQIRGCMETNYSLTCFPKIHLIIIRLSENMIYLFCWDILLKNNNHYCGNNRNSIPYRLH